MTRLGQHAIHAHIRNQSRQTNPTTDISKLPQSVHAEEGATFTGRVVACLVYSDLSESLDVQGLDCRGCWPIGQVVGVTGVSTPLGRLGPF